LAEELPKLVRELEKKLEELVHIQGTFLVVQDQ
jgi:hypothetical protein